MIELRAAASPGEVQVAALRDGVLQDFALWRPGAPDGLGDIYRGRVVARVKAMAGVFVALDNEDGFLPDTAGGRDLNEGTILAVRVTRSASGGKGKRLAAVERDCGAGSPALLERGPDPILELAAAYPEARLSVDDAAWGMVWRRSLGDRVAVVHRAFDESLAGAIETLGETDVSVPGGARLAIWPTPALVAIDVDSAGMVDAAGHAPAGGRGAAGGKAGGHAALNRRVLPALAAQIRLRNLSGAIVVDLAGMAVRQRAALGPDIARVLASDLLAPRFLGFTALGLAEIVRPRRRPPLHEMLAGPHAAGLAGLRAVLAATGPDPRSTPALRASSSVVTALRRDPEALADLARRTGQALSLREDRMLPGNAWRTEPQHG